MHEVESVDIHQRLGLVAEDLGDGAAAVREAPIGIHHDGDVLRVRHQLPEALLVGAQLLAGAQLLVAQPHRDHAEREVVGQLLQEADLVGIEGVGALRVHGEGAERAAVGHEGQPAHGRVAVPRGRRHPRAEAVVGGDVLDGAGKPGADGRANRPAPGRALVPRDADL